jgi:DNA processing protein
MDEKKYWLALLKINKIGPVNFMKILSFFGSAKNAWEADIQKWSGFNISEEIISDFTAKKNIINPDDLIAELEKEKIKVVSLNDADYPELLKEIHTAPPLIYYRGTLPTAKNICLGVVGARKVSTYGVQVVKDLVGELVRNNISIVSGLALGIDALSHQATLENKGKTFAVLGSGIDDASIYPKENINLARKIIASGGCIMSEYPPKTQATIYNFPARNRIISGLSFGTLVVEADIKSGSLITAQYALEQNRNIYAVPGSVYSNSSRGTNNLIRQGAKVVTGANDILEDLNIQTTTIQTKKSSFKPQAGNEEMIYNCLSTEPIHIDQIAKQTKLEIAKISTVLILLEMRGVVRNTGRMNYVTI